MRTRRTKALDQTDIATEVSSLLPTLAAEGYKRSLASTGRTLTVRICPKCGGTKSPYAMTCLPCLRADQDGDRTLTNVERMERLPRSVQTSADVRSTHHVHTSGIARSQPPRPRRVLMDGVWVEEPWRETDAS